MRILTTLVILAFAVGGVGGEEIDFQTTADPSVRGLELNEKNRAILKITERIFIILELIDSNRDGKWESYTETCSVAWTLVTPRSIETGMAKGSIRYIAKQTATDNFTTRRPSGQSTAITIADGITVPWTYASPKSIFLFPPPNIAFATVEVEQAEALKP